MIILKPIRWMPIAFAVFVVAILVIPTYVYAESSTTYSMDINFQPIGNNDVIVNRADESATNNPDSWDPAPTGVWSGGWVPESRFALDECPADDFTLGLASVAYFTPSEIMSGASEFTVRLPIHSGNWTTGYLNIYEISTDSNWTFVNMSISDGKALGNFRLNFTAGTHRLTYFSMTLNQTDSSPSDGNDHFTRSYRTYVNVVCPIRPNTFYLFVGYFNYPADEYVSFYWEPDSISDGRWNRSTVAYYNSYAPDEYVLPVQNFPVSLGWSFDFKVGYGNGGAIWDAWFRVNDKLTFAARLNKTNLNPANYLSFMFPFWATIPNVSIEWKLEYVIPENTLPSHTFSGINNDSEYTDFIIDSSTDSINTNLTGADYTDWQGWLIANLVFKNETRLRFFMRDCPSQNNYWQSDWVGYGTGSDGLGSAYAWDNNYSWDPTQYFLYTQYHGAGPTTNAYQLVFFQLDYSVKATPFQYVISTPGEGVSKSDIPPTPGWMKSFWWKAGYLLLGSVLSVFMDSNGWDMAYYITSALYSVGQAALDALDNVVSDFLDEIWDELNAVGHWLWKIGQSIVKALEWIIDQLIYYGSIILGIILFMLAFIVLFVPLWATLKIAMAFRKALFGDIEGAAGEIKGMITQGSAVVKKIPGINRIGGGGE